MIILALDAALARCSAAVVADGVECAARQVDTERGHAALLPQLAESVLTEAGLEATGLDLIAVTVGPGSFTGLRAGLALAHGLALGAGCKVVGVTVGEVLSLALPHRGGRALWSVVDSRRGTVFLERPDSPEKAIVALTLRLLPPVPGPVAVAGDAASAVAASLAARGDDVMLTDARRPRAREVAAAAALRAAGALPPLPARPLYVDAPEARPTAG